MSESIQQEPIQTPAQDSPAVPPVAPEEPVQDIPESPAVSEPVSNPPSEIEPTQPSEQSQPLVPPEPQTQEAPVEPPPVRVEERIVEHVRPPNEEDVRIFNSNQLKALAPKAREVRRSKKQNRLDAIVEHLKAHGFIANDDVEKLLHVSDATATRYLRELVKSGIAVKLGRGGRGARYRLVQGNQ